MGGKTSKSTQTVSIPPEVLARYNAVNARAEQAATQPFQVYSQDPNAFVAPLTQSQLAGMANINAAAGQAQPFFQSATSQLLGAQGAAMPYYQTAAGDITSAQNIGDIYQQQALQGLYAGQGGASAYNQAAAQAYQQAFRGAEPLQQAGVGQLYAAGAVAQPLQQQAAYNIGAAQDIGRQMAERAFYAQQQAGQGVTPLQAQSLQNLQQAYAGAQPFNLAAAQQYYSGLGAAQPLQQQALATLGGAGDVGSLVAAQALASLGQGAGAAAPLQQLAQGVYGQAYQAAQPYNQLALQQFMGGLGAAGPLSQAALTNLAAGQQIGQDITGLSLAQLGAGQAQAAPVQQAALQAVGAAPGVATPLQQAAQRNIAAAQFGVQPYQQAATQLGLAGARAVTPTPLGSAEIQQYISPYLSNVVGQTQALLNQQAQQAQAEQLGNAIRSGAFGGDRAAIAAANLQQQQQLAQGKVLSDLLQSGYGQALQTAQQQQQLGLSAEQANRAAQQQAAAQLLGVGQAGFGQGITAAQQQAALGQQLFGQQLGAGQAQAALAQQLFGQGATAAQQQQAAAQALFGQSAQAAQQQAALAQQLFGQQLGAGQATAGLGQQIFGQGLGAGQAQAALAQQLFGQGATTAQQQAAISQALFGQGATQAAQQAALAQQGFGQNVAAAQGLAGLGQQIFGQGTGTAAQQAALAQQMFGQGMSQAQQQAALSQLLYGQGQTAAQQQAALAQQQFAQALGGGQALMGAGQQVFGQGMAGGQAQQALAQQLFAQGLAGSQQQAALGQQAFGQDIAAAQARQALGQGLFGMGAATSQQLAGLGTGAQAAALQGAQAQMAAGQIQQQTQQAGLQALYNQFLQQQAYPFQVAQFLANVAMGTGALSGSTTTTTQPGSIFSDIRTKENVRRVGETFDGQPIYSFNYKGDKKTQMGLIAQEVERHHPEAVGETGGLKTVNYEKATRDAARRGHVIDAEFSPISEGGSVTPERRGLGFADGGMPTSVDDDAKRRAEEEMRQQQAMEESRRQQAAEAAVRTAREPAKSIEQPRVDMKPDVGAKPDISTAPTKRDIPSQPIQTPQLATASGVPAADQGSKDAQAIAALMVAMSDRRLKEDIEHIGHTYDGQKIYSYRIKGDPTTQIGLMADEVEDRHPEAVGSLAGFKTVDYDKATEDAARKSRGGYADGGSPSIVGGSDMAALLAAQAAMYGPYAQFGRQMGGQPGMPGYIPGTNLPVSELVTAPGLPTSRSGAEDLRAALDIGKDIQSLRRKPTPPPAPSPTPAGGTTETETPGSVSGRSAEDFDENFRKNYYQGGLAFNPGVNAMFAAGGPALPYDPVTKLDIPTEMSQPEMLKAGELPKQRSTMDDLRDIVGIASDIDSMRKKSAGGLAGRHGYAVDGSVRDEDPSFAERMIPGIQTQAGVDANRRDIMQFLQDRIVNNPAINPMAAARRRDENLRRQPGLAPAGDTTTREQRGATGSWEAPPAATATTTRPPARPTTPRTDGLAAATGTTPPVVPPVVPPAAVPPAPAAGLTPPVVPPAPAVTTAPVAPAPGLVPPAAAPATATTPSEAPKDRPGAVRDWLTKNKDLLFPLLTGAATAAAVPTQNRLSALLVGAGAAGKAYQDVQQRQAELETERATAGQIQTSTRQTNAQIASMLQNRQIESSGGREFVIFADGSRMLLGQYLALPADQRAKLPLIGQAQVPGLVGMAGGTTPPAPAAPAVPPAGTPTPAVPAGGVTPPVVPGAVGPQNLAQIGETQFRQNAPAGQKKWLGSVGEEQYKQDFARLIGMPTEEKQRLIAENAKYQASIDAGAQASVGMGQNLNQMTSTILALPEGGITAPGILAPVREQAVKIANDIIGTISGAVGANPNDYQINEQDIAKGTAANKIGRFMAFAAANGADQNSLGGLETAKAMVPTTAQSKEEAIQLLAGMYIDKQRALDMQNYVREFASLGTNSGMPEAVLINNAMNAFRREEMYNDRAYSERKRALAALMERKNSAGVTMFEHMMKRGYPPEVIDQVAAQALYGRKDIPPIRGMANIILGI